MGLVQTAEGAGVHTATSPTYYPGVAPTRKLALCLSGPSFLPESPIPCNPGCLHSGSPVGVAPMSHPAVWPWRRGQPRCGVLPWALEGVRGRE